jgi:hypothetical protein
MLLVALAVTLAGAPDTSFREVVLAHVARYPAMTVTDLYKLTHQAAFGAEHAIPDSATAAAWLEREWSALPDTSTEALLDTIAPGGAAVRISLRAWKAAGRPQAAVLRAFLATGREHRGNELRFERYWRDVIALARESKIPFDVEPLVRHADQMRTGGYPAVSHSDIYKRTYAPAYRVVSRTALMDEG